MGLLSSPALEETFLIEKPLDIDTKTYLSKMAQWELTDQLSQYLDRHLVIPLLEFHTVNGVYDDTYLAKAKLELLRHTSMVDFFIEEYEKLYPDKAVPEEMNKRRLDVVDEFRRLQVESKPLFAI